MTLEQPRLASFWRQAVHPREAILSHIEFTVLQTLNDYLDNLLFTSVIISDIRRD